MKRYSGVKGLAYAAIMSALCWILVLLTNYTIGIGLIIMLVLPLCASLVTLSVEKKYVLVYFVSSAFIAFVSPELTLFIVVPSLLSGIVSGILMKHYIQGYYIIFLNAVTLTLLQIGATYLIRLILDVDMMKLFATLLKLEDISFSSMYYLFLYILSLIQASIAYLIASSELKKLNVQFNEKKNQFIPVLCIQGSLIILSTAISFLSDTIAYLGLGFTYFFSVVLAMYLFSFYQRKTMLKIQLPAYVIFLLLTIILGIYLPKEYRYLCLFLLPLSEWVGTGYILIYQSGYKKIGIHESLFDKE